MAETKTASKGRSKPRTRKTTKARKPATSKTRQRASSKNSIAKNGVAHADSARKAVEGTVKQTGHSVGQAGRNVGRAARKAKMPLLAGGAAVAGAAGGLALGTRHSKGGSRAMPRPKVKVSSRDLAKAAKDVGEFGVHVGELASELRKAREADGARRRSPIEVVLQGLTSRAR
jgi:hypothetical protein